MVVDQMSQHAVDRVFAALADATRRDILTRVLLSDSSVSVLAANYAMSFAAVQKHVAALERAGLVTKRRRGREQIVTGDIDALRVAGRLLDDLEAIWRTRLQLFEQILTDPDEGDPR